MPTPAQGKHKGRWKISVRAISNNATKSAIGAQAMTPFVKRSVKQAPLPQARWVFLIELRAGQNDSVARQSGGQGSANFVRHDKALRPRECLLNASKMRFGGDAEGTRYDDGHRYQAADAWLCVTVRGMDLTPKRCISGVGVEATSTPHGPETVFKASSSIPTRCARALPRQHQCYECMTSSHRASSQR